MKKIHLIAAISLTCIIAKAKSTSPPLKAAYKIYTNKHYHFSFEIPVGWKMTSNGDGINYTCKPVIKAEKAYYADYNEVFEIQVKPMNLDSAIDGAFRHGSADAYYRPRMSAEKKVDRVKGNVFTGLHEILSCLANLNKLVPEETTVADSCGQLYLSDGRMTIVLSTNGIALEEEDFNRLIQTLRF